MTGYHNPVLLSQSMEGLHIRPDGIYVDLTYGSGQSSANILQQLTQAGHLYAFDQDADAQANVVQDERFTFIPANFRHLKKYLQYHGVTQVDGILADLGVSSHQLDVAERGFSTRFDGPLDMRMDQRKSRTAAMVLSTCSEEELADLFYKYGEIPNARKLAAAIVRARKDAPIVQTTDLRRVSSSFVPKNLENRYLAQLFQALRIEVNQEMEVLEEMLRQSVDLLRPGGRLVIISYHSLEDRMVKQFMRSGNVEDKVEKDMFGNAHLPFRLITRKAIVPDAAEIASNNRSRSAKLRICEKI